MVVVVRTIRHIHEAKPVLPFGFRSSSSTEIRPATPLACNLPRRRPTFKFELMIRGSSVLYLPFIIAVFCLAMNVNKLTLFEHDLYCFVRFS